MKVWTLALLVGLAAPARAGQVDDALAHVWPRPLRQELKIFLKDVPRDGPQAEPYRALLPLVIVEDELAAPRPGQTARDWLAEAGGRVAAGWPAGERPEVLCELVLVLSSLVGAERLPEAVWWPAARAAAGLRRPEAAAWLARCLAEPEAAAMLATLHRRAGRLEDAARVLAEHGGSPWAMAALAAAGRAARAGLAIDLEVLPPPAFDPAAPSLRDGTGAPWLSWRVRSTDTRLVTLALTAQVLGVTDLARTEVVLPPGAELTIGQTPTLAVGATVPARPVSLQVRAEADGPAGPVSLLNTTAPLPVGAAPAAVEPSGSLVERITARAATLPAVEGDWPPAEQSVGDEATVAVAAWLLRRGLPVQLLRARDRWLVGLVPSPRWGLTRQVDEVGAPRKPAAAVEQAASRRLGFLPTADRAAMQLDPNRDTLMIKPGQALGPAPLPAEPEERPPGSIPLWLPTPDGPSVWLVAEELLKLGPPAGLAAGYLAAEVALPAALWPVAPEAARQLAATELRGLDERGQVLETVLEGRHGVRLAELQGRSFYGGPAPGVAADREPASGAQAAVTAILDEVDRLWRRRQALARLIWRMDLAAGGESGAARLVSPRGLAERVPLPAWDSR